MMTTPYLGELGNRPRWFLNAELLAELDEEYRQKNPMFRAFVKATVASPTHPLHHLATPRGAARYQAGHVRPVADLRRTNTKLERLVVEDGKLNMGKHAKPITGIVIVDGVPVDCDTLKKWAQRRPNLQPWVDKCDKGQYDSRGWSSVSRTVLPGELEFVLSLPGTVWVRRETELEGPWRPDGRELWG
jgi:hypothetical protein